MALAQEARAQPKSLGRLRRIVGESLKLAWQADRRLFIVATTLQLVGGVLMTLQILVIKSVLDSIIKSQQPGGSIRDSLVPVALFAAITTATTVSSALQTHWQRLLGELVTRLTWQRILNVTAVVDLREFESPAFYDRLQRVQTNAVSRPFLLTQGLIGFVGTLANSVGLAVALATIQPLLLPLLLISGIPLYLATRLGGNLEFRFAVGQSTRLRLRQYLSELQTARDPAKEIRAFAIAGALRQRFDAVYERYIADLRRHVRQRAAVSFASSAISALILAGTLFVIIWLVTRHELTLGDAGAAIVAVRQLSGQISSLFGNISQVFESGLFLEDLHQFLDSGHASGAAQDEGEQSPRNFDLLEVRDLTFTYPGATTPALRGVDLDIRSGEVVALVGENGSGKTTLAKILASLYEPDTGSISWDGADIRRFQRTSRRRSVAVIFQDFIRYQLSARDNVGFGQVERIEDTDAIWHALHHSGADALVESLPEGLDTLLSRQFSGGRDLSGGQWQRIALARAFFRDAPFVILDEPSAALDPRAEHELFESLRRLLAGRTVLFISHRMSTVRTADRIFVLANGEVIEHGKHDDLVAAGGYYAELFALQAAAYLDSAAD